MEETIQDRTRSFAIRVVRAYVHLSSRTLDDAGRILGKQFLRSGTSIGANCAEAKYAQSNNDFISKYSIALKEAAETEYWIQVLIDADVVTKPQFVLLQQELTEIMKILTTTINKLKQKINSIPLVSDTYYLLLITYYLLLIT
jgi:four helix bundle protein